MNKDPNFVGFLHSGNSEELIDKDVMLKLHRYWVLAGLHQSKQCLSDGNAKEFDNKSYKRQMRYLRRQIFLYYFKNIFFFPIWLIKILTPSFFKGSPSIWTNLKLILTRKEFQPLRMAMVSWLVFTYLLIQGGIFLFHKNVEFAEAASFTWLQTGWVTSSTNNAAHATDRTGWTQYWDVYPTNITTTTGTELTLSTGASSTAHTTTADFNRGTTSTASVVSNGVVLSSGGAIATSAVAGRDYGFCGLSKGGSVYCWGLNTSGELGNGTTGGNSTSPVQVVGVGGSGVLSNIIYIGGGGNDVCAVNSSNNVFCWGDNSVGELGNNNGVTDSNTPVQVVGVGGTGNLSNITQVATGEDHACALNSSGNVYCWGEGGKLGNNGWGNSATPVQVLGVGGSGTLDNITEIKTGWNHTCALNSSNNVFCWGAGTSGRLGNNAVDAQPAPVQVVGVGGAGTLGSISSICEGLVHGGAIDSSGNMYMWGENAIGQLGNNGGPTDSASPVQVVGVGGAGTLANLSDCSGGWEFSNAVNTSGSVFSWGDNFYGNLVDNNQPTDSGTPVQAVGVGGSGNLSNISQIASTWYTGCSLNTSDSVYCWGSGSDGERGDGTTVSTIDTPVQVVGVGGSGTLALGTAYSSSGTFTSNIIDTVSSTAWNTMTWTTSTAANTTLTMKVRTGQRADMSDATAWGTCNVIDNTGDDISANNCVTDGERYIQYQAALGTSDTSITPELQDVTINYTRYTDVEQTLTSSMFNTGDSTNILSSMAWSETLPNSNTDIKFQIRTSADGTTWTSWLGPTDGTDYYTNPAGGETINSNHTSGGNDQWMQYKIFMSSVDGGSTPTLSDVTLTYVINEAPQISGSGVTATQLSNGTISITWGAYDSDTGTATTSFQYSLNNGSTWSDVLGHLSSAATTTRSISSWTTSTVVWTPKSEIDGQDVSQAKIKVIENDGELANATVSSTSAAFALDLTDPTLASPVMWVVATTTPATVYHSVTDTNNLQMVTSLDSAVAGATWSTYATTSTITLASDPDIVYTQYRDSFSNTTTIQSVTTPETPTSMVIKDISNAATADYNEFIIWATVAAPTPGFSRYDIFRSTDGSSYSFLASSTTRTTNYYLDSSVSANTTYYYKVYTVDSNKNTSAFSSVVSDNADGQGGTDVTAPTISNRAETNTTTQGFTITWDTDEVSSSSVAVSAGAFGGSFTTTTVDTMVKAAGGSLGQHSVTVSGLTPNTTYYYQLSSADPNGNIVFDNNSGAGYSITTLDGPSISNVATDSVDNTQATIVWATDVSADSTVYYSTASNLSGSSNKTSATATTDHSITITGLTQGTTYYYYVTSGVATDTNSGNYYSFITTNDTTAPTISTVASSPVADTTSVITWTTNEGSTTQLLYGTTSGSLTTYSTLATGLNLSHTVSLTGLTANTKYYYTVSSVDGSGNATTSTESNFTTSETLSTATEVAAAEAVATSAGAASVPRGGGGAAPMPVDIVPPAISNIRATSISSESATIEWSTDEAGDSIVQYGNVVGDLRAAAIDVDSLKTKHSLTVADLLPSTQYSFKVSTADKSGNRAKSPDQSFTTLSGFEEIDTVQELGLDGVSEEQGGAESVFKSLIEKTADLIRKLSGQVSIDTLELGLATQYTTIKELGRLVPLPLISGQPVVEVGASYAKFYWTTDKESNSLVAIAPDSTYKNNQEYTQVIGDATEAVTNHEVLISELKPNTLYHYQVRSKTPVSDTAKSRDFTFTTKNEQLEIITYKIDSEVDTEAVFSWTTNIPTDSKVLYIPYGKDGALIIDSARSVFDKAVTTLHEVKTKDMEAGLTYQVELSGEDLNGNIVSKTISTFSTSEVDAPPIITQVQTDAALLPGDQTAVQAILSWVTNEPSTSQVYYQKGFGKTDEKVEFSQKTPFDPNYVKRHIFVITNFEPGAVYQFQIESIDSSGNATRSRTYTVLTPRQKESVFQVIMSNIEETFSWVGRLGL